MVTTHEAGHLVGGWASGAELTACDLAPWRLPYSIHHPDPHPKVTLWAGPLIGVLLPLATAIVFRHRSVWLVADFRLIANGSYLALAFASDDRFLDTTRLLDAGTHPLGIVAFCLATIPTGYIRLRDDCVRLLSHEPDPTAACRS